MPRRERGRRQGRDRHSDEETAARTHLREEYFSDYRRYQLMQVDKTRVLLACRVIINDCWESCTAMITTSVMTAFWTMATAFPEN